MGEKKLTYSQILGNIIREEVIKEHDGTLNDFAIKSGVGHTVFFNLITGKVQNPSALQIARIAQYLKKTPGYFLDRKELLDYDFTIHEKDDPEDS